jgi:hypothetical protein
MSNDCARPKRWPSLAQAPINKGKYIFPERLVTGSLSKILDFVKKLTKAGPGVFDCQKEVPVLKEIQLIYQDRHLEPCLAPGYRTLTAPRLGPQGM